MRVAQARGMKIFLPNGPWLARPPPAARRHGETDPLWRMQSTGV